MTTLQLKVRILLDVGAYQRKMDVAPTTLPPLKGLASRIARVTHLSTGAARMEYLLPEDLVR